MHPWIAGRAGRPNGLERLIRAIRQEPGLWCATCMQVAEWAIETGQNTDIVVSIPEDRAGSDSVASRRQ